MQGIKIIGKIHILHTYKVRILDKMPVRIFYRGQSVQNCMLIENKPHLEFQVANEF